MSVGELLCFAGMAAYVVILGLLLFAQYRWGKQ